MAQSVLPYRNLIEALVTSGKIHDLIRYTECSWQWTGHLSLTATVTLLHQGMKKAYQDWLTNQGTAYLLIEARRIYFSYASTKKALSYYVSSFRKVLREHPQDSTNALQQHPNGITSHHSS